jgi:hypothetical protein
MHSIRRLFTIQLLLTVFLLASSVSLNAQVHQPESPEIHEFSGSFAFLSSAWMEGREAGSKGGMMAADFLASSLQTYNVVPFGDNKDGQKTYFQNFELVKYETYFASLSLNQISKDETYVLAFNHHVDFKVDPTPYGSQIEAPLVFAGYGIQNAVLGYNDYEKMEVKGKIILLLEGFPGHHDTLSKAWKSWGSVFHDTDSLQTIRTLLAAEKGARAVIFLTTEKSKEQSEIKSITDTDPVYIDGNHSIHGVAIQPALPVYHLNHEASELFARNCGFDMEQFEKTTANTLKPASEILKNNSASLHIEVVSEIIPARNVLGIIKGTDTTKSIIVGAHYDHLGKRGDYVYYGADDNASGTSGVLALAKRWSESKFVPSCNIIFAFWSAEEKGMLGSTYFVSARSVNHSNTALYMNFDMLSRSDPADSLQSQISIGLLTGTATIEQMAIHQNLKLSKPFTLDLWHTSGHGGSDYVPFAQQKIPVMSFFSGFHDDYHSSRDVFKLADLSKMQRILQLANGCMVEMTKEASIE